ncbi:Hypothetical Protein PANA_2974 [Pantoea ananatis LMG 20103]|uniref:FaeA n=3 Tax=Erwiniaceae TaxID=1903409 RepID=D4GKV2_PANAM|nr:FaeA/PapI family transcriptional regulator [Pantoea ananatis]ADD78141.1 Hypothetical Protein PANA_2974 [Pantoea ananatis LMG 20103]AER31592.1 hypothetical protein PAGR_g1061 [Pantoea ananatis PA13]PKC31128.1 hypothetical protein V462_17270 [Pantoea ananatis 15320]ASN14171.1 hypothetical protein B7764_02840 [Pantoea ananatis]NCU07007.1 hypothetical protein [Pantoea ananatis]
MHRRLRLRSVVAESRRRYALIQAFDFENEVGFLPYGEPAMKNLAYKIQCEAKWNQLQETEKKPKMKDVMMCLIKRQAEGIMTRDVADECDMSIYAARNWLLKLENSGLLKKEPGRKSCKWFIL